MTKKILIIKLGAMGDVVRTTAILPSLKEKYNDSSIHWVTKSNTIPLIQNHPMINKIYSIERNVFELLKKLDFDIIINLDEELNACSLATKLKKKKLYGFYLDGDKVVPTPSAKEWFDMGALGEKPLNDILKKENKKTHQRIMHEIINIPYKRTNHTIYLSKKQLEFSENFKKRNNISNEEEVIGLNTGAGDRWPKQLELKKTVKLIENLYKRHKARLILFGGPNEIERNKEILSLTKVPLIDAGCRNSLEEFTSLVNLCDLFITSDSMGVHVAVGLKKKIISFFGPTSANEIELYGLGKKIVPNSDCYCCYKHECTAAEKIDIKDIEEASDKLLKKSVSFIITAYKEPNLDKTLESAINQTYKGNYEIIVCAPDKETLDIAKKYKVKTFVDPGKGKSYALKLLFKEIKSDILILTDGDVFVNKEAIDSIVKKFKDSSVGAVTGRPIATNPKNEKYGFFSHLLLDAGAHRIRKELDKKCKFLECSGYLFAIRNVIKDFPLDVAEDSIIPYLLWKKGYKIRYEPLAKVYVKYPSEIKDFVKQRKRVVGAHAKLDVYYPNFPKVKSFKNEVFKGFFWALSYPKTIKELFWTLNLIPIRLHIWVAYYFDSFFKKRSYQDGWERVESTK
jgi:ADP-heptose:LPS heptosyltransferase